jgi:hypothetical protein
VWSNAALRPSNGPERKTVERMITERILFVHPFTIESSVSLRLLGFLIVPTKLASRLR